MRGSFSRSIYCDTCKLLPTYSLEAVCKYRFHKSPKNHLPSQRKIHQKKLPLSAPVALPASAAAALRWQGLRAENAQEMVGERLALAQIPDHLPEIQRTYGPRAWRGH